MAEHQTADETHSSPENDALPPRYADVEDVDGRTVIYDVEDPGAWISAGGVIEIAEAR